MTLFGWFLIAWWVVGLVTQVLLIGKPRHPLSAQTVAAQIVLTLALIVGALWVGTGSL